MPNCEDFEELCSASLDGKLTREQKRELDAHLAECPACAAYLEDLKLLRTAWGDLKEPLPGELHEKIMQGILKQAQEKAAPAQKKKRRPPVFTMLAAAAACVMLVTSGAVGDLLGGSSGKSAGGAGTVAPDSGAAAEEAPEQEQIRTIEPEDTAPEVAPSTLVPAQNAEPQPAPATEEPKESAPQDQAPAASSASGSSSAGGTEEAAAPYSLDTPALQSRQIPMSKAEKQSVTLPDNLQARAFGLCYVAVGSGDPLLLKDATLLEKIDNIYYFEVQDSMSGIEADIQLLQEGGFETAVRRDIGVTTSEDAESILLILVVEE